MATKDYSFTLKASAVTTVDTTEADWVYNSTTQGFYGITKEKKYKKTRNAIVIFDTSSVPQKEILDLIQDRKSYFNIGYDNGSRGYKFDDGESYGEEKENYGSLTFYKTSGSVATAKNYTYNKIKSLAKDSDPFYTNTNDKVSKVQFKSATKLCNTTSLVRIAPITNLYDRTGMIYPKDVTITITGKTAIPTVSNNGSSNEFVDALPYTLNLKYNHEFGGKMTNYTIKWTSSNGKSGSASGTKTVQAGGTFTHTFPANTFTGGETAQSVTVTFNVTVTSIDGNKSSGGVTHTAFCDKIIPSVTANSPINGAQIYKSNTNRFSWTYSDNAGKSQRAANVIINQPGRPELVYRVTSETYVDVPAGKLVNSVLTWSIQALSDSMVSKTFGPYSAVAINSTPTVTLSEPIHDETFKRSIAKTFKWNYSDKANTPQTKAVVNWSCGGSTGSKTITGTDKYTTFPAGTFPEGTLTYTVTVTNGDGVSATSEQGRAISQSAIPSVALTFPTDGIAVNYSQTFSITWNFTEDTTTGQKSWKVEIMKNGSVVKTYSASNDAKTCTITKGTLDDGLYTYKLTVTNGDGKTATATSSFNVVKAVPIIEMTYPVGILVKKDADINFLWNYSDSPIEVGQKKYTITIYKEGQVLEVVEETSGNHYHKFVAEHFAIGLYSYTLKVENNDGNVIESPMYTFTAIGQTESPTITEVTNDAKPIIKWSVGSQSAFEIEISSEGSVIYSTGIISDATAREVQIDKILENGKYNLKARVVNEYGYYSEFTEYSFIIDAENENEVADVFVTLSKDFAINIDYSAQQDLELYVARRETLESPVEILGEFKESFTDYTACLNKNYLYAVLNYDVGIKYSVWKNMILEAEGVVLRSADDKSKFVNLWKTTNTMFTVKKNNARTKNTYNCLGRTYPIREFGEWMNKQRTFSAYVTDEEYDILTELHLSASAVQYQADGEYMLCDFEMSDSSDYIGGGKMVDIILTQIDE